MIKVKKGNIKIKGNSLDLLSEATLSTAETIRLISGGDNEDAEALLYAIIKGVIKALDQYNIVINVESIGDELAKSTD